MGVEPNELVSLILVCEIPEGGSNEICDFKRTLMSGPPEADFFAISEGKVLIVTEFDWKYINTTGSDLEDQPIEVHLNRKVSPIACALDPKLCPLPPLKSFGIANQFGSVIGGGIFASGNVQMTTGFAITFPSTLLVNVLDMFGTQLPIHNDFADLQVTVRGYLVTATCGIPGAPPCR